MRKLKIDSNNKGFTIIELLIATAVFSVVLMLVTYGILQIGKSYYKGINATRTQEVARNVIEEISRAIQFSGGQVTNTSPGSPRHFCVDNNRFSYALDQQVGPNNAPNALVVDKQASCTAPLDLNVAPPAGARSLLPTGMRLAKMEVTKQNYGQNLYTVTVRVVYGDTDLLDPATHSSCRSTAGSQFCAVSELSTTVQKRIE